MARMYPKELSNVKSRAEVDLFIAFEEGLDSSYTVFHSVPWLGLDENRRPRDGETDFVVAHPQRGILVLEAKGGGIGYDQASGHWTSRDQSGTVYDIKDPFIQVKDSKYKLLDELRKSPNMPKEHINIGHAVAFPEIRVGDVISGLDKPRDIILDQGDLDDISSWVGQALAYWRGNHTQEEMAPGEGVVGDLMDMLGKSLELRPTLWGEFQREREQLIKLTKQQHLTLNMLNRQRQACISGCAGSGKTTLAIEKARRLAGQQFRVLFTCYNKSLAADIRGKLAVGSCLHVYNYHDLCYELAERAGVLPPMPEQSDSQGFSRFFDQQLPEALLEAADVLADQRYDAIVVDEAQDFMDNWWMPLQYLLHDPDGGIFYIFYDDNQRLYDRENQFPIQQPPYPLTVNCRNTRNIHKQVLKYYQGEDIPPTALGPKGRPVDFQYYSDENSFHKKLERTLQELIFEEQVPTEQIVVLTPLRKNSWLWGADAAGSISLTSEWPPEGNQVFATTIHSFKGLESAVVLLAEVERWPNKKNELENLLYVACSRARNHLIVMRPVLLPKAIARYFT